MLPGVGRSLSGQHPARALHKTPSCSACSRLSESSSHRKAPAASVCPGQGSWSRKTKTSHGEPTLYARPCHVYDGHSLMSPHYNPARYVVTPVSSGSSERKRDLPEATQPVRGEARCGSPQKPVSFHFSHPLPHSVPRVPST